LGGISYGGRFIVFNIWGRGMACGLLKPGIAAVGALHIAAFFGNDVIRHFVLGTTIRAGQTHKTLLDPGGLRGAIGSILK